jgi:hypothetical protein
LESEIGERGGVEPGGRAGFGTLIEDAEVARGARGGAFEGVEAGIRGEEFGEFAVCFADDATGEALGRGGAAEPEAGGDRGEFADFAAGRLMGLAGNGGGIGGGGKPEGEELAAGEVHGDSVAWGRSGWGRTRPGAIRG